MSILLAVNKQDGKEAVASSSLPALIPDAMIIILTPRSPHAARGATVSHIFETDAFRALPAVLRDPVLAAALPSIATTDCPECRRKWLNESGTR